MHEEIDARTEMVMQVDQVGDLVIHFPLAVSVTKVKPDKHCPSLQKITSDASPSHPSAF